MDGHHMSKGLSVLTRNHLFFRGWSLDSWKGLVAAMLVSVILSVSLEFVNLLQVKLTYSTSSISERCGWTKCVKTILHVLRVLIGYILMLCVMTMNVWIYVSVILGAGVGYFFKAAIGDTKVKETENYSSQYQDDEHLPPQASMALRKPLLETESSINNFSNDR